MNYFVDYFKKLSPGETVVFFLGFIVTLTQTVRYVIGKLDLITGELVVFGIGFLCMIAPKVLTSIFKTRGEK